jgi:hypothetical protein
VLPPIYFSTEDSPQLPPLKRLLFLPIIAFAHAEKHNRLRHRAEDRLGVARRGGEHGLRIARAQGSREALGVPVNRSAEPGSLMVRGGFDDRAELLAAAPDVYYVADHYLDYNAVLVRLSRVTPGVLLDLLGMAHKFVTADAAPPQPCLNPGSEASQTRMLQAATAYCWNARSGAIDLLCCPP